MRALVSPEAETPNDAARAIRAEWRSRQIITAAARLMERDGFHGVSIQALADEASVSVGLIYRYFGSKDDLLLAVIIDVLDAFAARVPPAVEAAGEDPAEQIAAAFRAYCEVVREHRHAAVLTYQESRALSPEGRDKIKKLEIETSEPLRAALREGQSSGLLVAVDVELVANDLLMMAHAWALKGWYLRQSLQFDEYVAKQTALVLSAVIAPRRRRRYQHLLKLAS